MQNAELMAKGKDLEPKRRTAPKGVEKCGQKGGQEVPQWESKEKEQLPVCQPDRILREAQSKVTGDEIGVSSIVTCDRDYQPVSLTGKFAKFARARLSLKAPARATESVKWASICQRFVFLVSSFDSQCTYHIQPVGPIQVATA